MNTVIIYILFIAICVLYGVARTRKSVDKVLPSYAGPLSEHVCDTCDCTVTQKPSCVIKLPNGKYANTHSYHRIRIIGGCLEMVGIHKNEEWLADKVTLSDKESVPDTLSKGDVLLIYLNDKGIYKIRCFESLDGDGNLITYSYPEGKRHVSSKPHSPSSVLGVVKYKLPQT